MHCADALVYLLQLTLQNSFLSSTMLKAMDRESFRSAVWETMDEKKDRFVHRHGASWDFSCPVCEEFESVLCELDEEDLLDNGVIRAIRLHCTHCDFSVGDFSKGAVLQPYQPILCNVLLHDQIQDLKKEDIIAFLSGFGSDAANAIRKLRVAGLNEEKE